MKKVSTFVSLDSIKLSDKIRLVEFYQNVNCEPCCYLEFNSMIIGQVVLSHDFDDIFKIGDFEK